MSQSPETGGRTVDVAALMAEIRAGIEEKRRQGMLTTEDLERLEVERLRAFGVRARIDPRLLRALLHPSHDWNIHPDYPILTRRRGPVGWALVFVKRLVRPLVRLYTDHLLSRQAQINLYFHYFLTDAVRELLRLRIEVARLEHRCRTLEAGKKDE